MRSRFVTPVLTAACLALIGCGVTPPDAEFSNRPSEITNGTLDGNAHPAVVLLVMDVAGSPAFRCSGTLIAPKVLLTAGTARASRASSAACASSPSPTWRTGTTTIPSRGRTRSRPPSGTRIRSSPRRCFFLHDVGVVLLSKPVRLAAGQYGKLPSVNQLDGLKNGSATTFTAVGTACSGSTRCSWRRSGSACSPSRT